jgi:hypothetical protein
MKLPPIKNAASSEIAANKIAASSEIAASSDQEFDSGVAYGDEWESDVGGEPGGNSTPAETAQKKTRKRKRVSPAEAKKIRAIHDRQPHVLLKKKLHIAGQRALKQLIKDFPPCCCDRIFVFAKFFI